MRPFLTFLCFYILLWFDDDVNGPLSTSFSILGLCRKLSIVLTDLLLCWGPNGSQALSWPHLCSCYWALLLQFLSRAAFWVQPLICTMETKVVKFTFTVDIENLMRTRTLNAILGLNWSSKIHLKLNGDWTSLVFCSFLFAPLLVILVAQRKDFHVIIGCGMIQTFLDVLGILTHLLTDCFIIFDCAHWLCCLAIDSCDLLRTLV